MSTISSMTNNTYMMYKFAASSSAEASGSTDSTTQSLASMKALVSSMSGNSSSNTSSNLWGSTTSSSSSSSLWSAYNNSAASEAASTLSTITGMKNTISNMMSSYTSTKKLFNTEFKSAMSDLKSSAQTAANMSYNFISDDITTSNGTTKYSESLTSAIKSVKSLVSDYNDALSFFSDNSSVSKRVKRLSNTFSDTTYRAGVYSSVGITVDSSGKLSLDESKLADALVNNSDTAEYVLGKNGLAGKAESHVATANAQSSQLFPSASSMLGDIQGYSSLYSSNTLNSMNKYLGIGNMVNMYF